MNVLCSTFVPGTSTPPLSLFLQAGHVLDVAGVSWKSLMALQALFTGLLLFINL